MNARYRRTRSMLCAALLTAVLAGCSSQKNTAGSRWWHAFNARYNTYFNGEQAFIEGNLEKEKGNRDNYTEILPLYAVGNKESREIGSGQYDRAIEKSEKAIRRHSIKTKPEWNGNRAKTAQDREWLGRREYNPFLWRAWLLLGKAQFQKGAFDEAAATFSYMSRIYHTQPMMNGLARAWLAKCYTELDWMYDAEDVIRNMSRDSMDFRAVKDWDYTFANYYLRTRDYDKAIPYLRKAIGHERRSVQRARMWYLMGQVERIRGNKDAAYKAFGKVIGCHPPYELEFNARISQTEVMAEGNGRQMVSRLRRMAASDNNKEYLDQVYYAIGNIHLNQRDTAAAISAYEKGNTLSTRNGIEKGVLLLTLGNLYWQREQFNDAQRCYGEAIGLLDRERPDYETLAYRSKVLDELVPHTDAIHLQDSLLALAEMPETERTAVIDRLIADYRKQLKAERDAQREMEAEMMAMQNGAQNNGLNNNTPTPAVPVAGGGNGQWYFYNPTAVSQGKASFQRLWGKRENVDNWQRINQTVLNRPIETTQGEEDEYGSEGTEDSQAGEPNQEGTAQGTQDELTPEDAEYYLAQIPFTEAQKTACHDIIQDALFRSGIIFKDKLDNLRLSERQLLRLTHDYPNYAQLDEAWYHLFLLYSRKGERQQAENCISHLKAEHPQSEWTILLTDPYYTENARFGTHIEDSLYAATYEAFKNDRHDIVATNVRLSAERFPLGENRPKFLFIDGLSRLNDGDGEGCVERLQEVVEKYPESEVSALAGMIVKGVQDGRRLHGGKFDIGNVWSRRDIALAKDSTVTDTLSALRDDNFRFILAYQPDSVNENQLLFDLARYNFTNFLVRNFELVIDEDEGMHRMSVSGFLSYDEAVQYARQLYADPQMAERLKDCRSLIISETNLALMGTRFSYDDYQQFYEETLLPMRVSEEKLLIIPDSIEAPDIEEGEAEEEEGEEEEEMTTPTTKQQQKVVFEFGEEFW